MTENQGEKTVFLKAIYHFFALDASHDQARVIEAFVQFVYSEIQRETLVLTGFAGTGKTTLLGALVRALKTQKKKTILLAPTGRAAKVLSMRSNQLAFTIHKRIYRKENGEAGRFSMALAPNLAKNTLFIVDEASMLGDFSLAEDGSHVGRNLLEDLIQFVYSGEGCKLIFVGDEGQLPPVGSDFSPALNLEYLNFHFPFLSFHLERLSHVLRQAEDSDILLNATALRSAEKGLYPQFILNKKKDLIRVNGADLQESLEDAYSKFGSEECIIITRSNKRANQFNQEVRNRILYREEDICGGDLLMVVKNNYFWLEEKSRAGFIANGEIIQIKRILKRETRAGFQFVRATVVLIDFPEIDQFETLLWVDCLAVEKAAMPREAMKTLFFEIEKDYLHEQNQKKRYERIMKDPYMNALQVKFAYAVTCHKSQGGQWSAVFLDHGFLTDEMLDESFFRWMYTGFTRASEQLYLVNFDPHFFPAEEE